MEEQADLVPSLSGLRKSQPPANARKEGEISKSAQRLTSRQAASAYMSDIPPMNSLPDSEHNQFILKRAD